MKRALKIPVFLVLFTAAAVGVTYVLIQRTLGEPLIRPKVDLPYEEVTPEAGIDLSGFYDENHLLFTEVLEENGDVRIAYPQIDGLKDAGVESAVNEMIAAKAGEIKAYHESGGGISYLTYQVQANFANALSIGFFSADGEYNARQDYMNINLNDGSLFELSDLFCVGADIQRAVRAGFYEVLTRYNLSPDYWEELSAPNEEELYRVVRNYLAGEQRFSFSPAEIYLHYEDYTATVPMIDYAEDIAIYHRFVTEESLYERDDIGYKNIFTCATMPDGHTRRGFAMVGDNLWYDVALEEIYRDTDVDSRIYDQVDAFMGKVYEDILAEVQTLTETAKANPHRAYVLLAAPSGYLYADSEYVDGYWRVIPSKAMRVNENYVLYEMDYALFDSVYREILVNTYREDPYYLFYVGLGEEADRENMTITKRSSDTLWLYETGEELTVEDVFVSGYDYDTAIRTQAKYDLAAYYDYTYEDAEAAVASAWYELVGTGIAVRLPDWGEDQYMWISLSDLGTNNLSIFQ